MTFPVFAPGNVLTASDMNAVGLWLVKTQTIGTAVSTVTVSNAFSSDYENYKIIVKGSTTSAASNIFMTLGSTNTGYYYASIGGNYGSQTATYTNGNNTTGWLIATSDTTGFSSNIELSGPNVADQTTYAAWGLDMRTTGSPQPIQGFVNNTTVYTAFTLSSGANTMTGGTISVYGYKA